MLENVRCDVLRTSSELESFQASWRELWKQDENATPFQSPAWLLPWWRQFGEGDLRAIVISRNSKPVAFLPFYIYRAPVRDERQLLLLGIGTSDYLDGVFSSECSIDDVTAALNELWKLDEWDVLYAGQLREQSKLFQALQQRNFPGTQSFRGESCSRMQAVRQAELRRKLRKNASYYRRRAERIGKLCLDVANGEDWPDPFETLVRLNEAEWQSKGQPSVLLDPRVLACHREAIPRLERLGTLRLISLRLNGEAIAVIYSLVDPAGRQARTQYVYLTAYSQVHAELAPGSLLLALVLEQAANEGVEKVDMLRGEEGYKKLWHVESLPTFGISVRRNRQG